jgi:putative SOS response-associated peptidase YedK
MDNMNSGAEDVSGKVTYKKIWIQQQLCIVPAMVYEQNLKQGTHERWAIELASGDLFGMPRMWRTWSVEDGTVINTFNHFTLNANIRCEKIPPSR